MPTISIDFTDERPFIQTYLGEDASCDLAEYGIGIEDLHITLSPESALDLWKKLGKHLAANGRISYERREN